MHKINRLTIYLMILSALFLHLTLLNFITIFGVRPDLMIILVIFFGLFLGPSVGLEAGIFAGLMKDIFVLDFFGINMFVFSAIGILAGVLGAKFSRESARTLFLLAFFLTFLSMMLHYILASIFSKWLVLNFPEYLFSSIIPTSLYTSLIALPIFSKLISKYNLIGQGEYL